MVTEQIHEATAELVAALSAANLYFADAGALGRRRPTCARMGAILATTADVVAPRGDRGAAVRAGLGREDARPARRAGRAAAAGARARPEVGRRGRHDAAAAGAGVHASSSCRRRPASRADRQPLPPRFPEVLADDRAGVLARAKAAGVTGMVTISTRVKRFDEITAIAEAHPEVWCSVGTHPHNAHEEPDIKTADLVRLSAAPALRRHRRGRARLPLRGRLRRRRPPASAATSRPRARPASPSSSTRASADDDTAKILEEETAGQGAFPFVLHCFSAGPALARRGLALGGYISFSGILTFKNAAEIQEVAAVGAGRPHPRRDRRAVSRAGAASRQANEPSYVRHTAEKLAELRGVSARGDRPPDHRRISRGCSARPGSPMAEASAIVATIMGCGSSGGVPRIGGNWGVCDPANPKNRRRRCSLLLDGHDGRQRARRRRSSSTPAATSASSCSTPASIASTPCSTPTSTPTTRTASTTSAACAQQPQARRRLFQHEAARSGSCRSFSYCFTAPPGQRLSADPQRRT